MMKNFTLVFLALLSLSVAWAAGLSAQNPGPGAVIRWQHLALEHDATRGTTDQELSRRINRLGNEGWQLIDVETVLQEGTTTKIIFYFKKAQ